MKLHLSHIPALFALFLVLSLTACSSGTAINTAASIEDTTAPNPLTGLYFKAGNFSFLLDLAPGDLDERDSLSLVFSERSPDSLEWSNGRQDISAYLLPRDVKAGSYEAESTLINAWQNGLASEGTITIHEDGIITLSDGTDASGDYYPYEELLMPAAFRRPINSTDLIGLTKKDLQLIRNQFYAVYGREFSDKDLRAYFERQPWYQGTIKAGQFQEEILGGMLKRNILFLKTAEDAFDETQAAYTKAAYESLSPAPYQDLLPEYGEVLVTIPAKAENAVDKGIYYEAKGTIAIPITLTPEQMELLQDSETLELVTDELTGETETIKKSTDPSYGQFVFGEEENEHYVMASYRPETGLFELWHDSADTDFKRIYEGNLYILKGAMEEYYGYFDLPVSGRKKAAGSYRSIDFEEDPSDPDPLPYSGNYLSRDSKGYIKSLYFVGD